MTDALGRIERTRDPSQNPRGRAIDALMELMQYRRDLLEARALARDIDAANVTTTDDDIRNVNAAILAARQDLASARPEGLTLADPEPDLGLFYGMLAVHPDVGFDVLTAIDVIEPNIQSAMRERNWMFGWALIAKVEVQVDSPITAAVRAAIDTAWTSANMPPMGE